jgi:hypothetical protein
MRKGTQPTQGLLRVILTAFGVIAATVVPRTSPRRKILSKFGSNPLYWAKRGGWDPRVEPHGRSVQ